MKIPIHKHTPVRYKMSKYTISFKPDTLSHLPLNVVTDISRVPKRKNWEWVGVPTREPVRLESDNKISSTLVYKPILKTKPLGFWQNIKYHIIWWKK